jgi:succinate dehydrogenase/fumarate reductase cytochrome b subunit
MSALHKLHRVAASIIALFVAAHLSNHLLALQGVQAHLDFMNGLRHVYRNIVVETVLLVCVLFQVGSGIYFLRARWGQRRGFFDRLQAASGGYLAFFLVVHVSAVMLGRAAGLDTNFYFAAAGMHIAPYHFFFVPYYFLAIAAIFGHLACAFHWLAREPVSIATRNVGACAVLACGVLASTLIVAVFGGVFYDVTIPAAYRATFAR